MKDALLVPCVNECGNNVNVTSGDPWEEHKGFARKRDQGGLNALKLRRPTGSYMCDDCMTKALHGVAAGQYTLV